MAVTIKGKKGKNLPPHEIVDEDVERENLKLSKEEYKAKYKKIRENKKKAKELYDKLMKGENVEAKTEDDIEVLENELKALVKKYTEVSTMADDPKAEAEAKELKKKVTALKIKITKAKKELKK